MKKRKTQAGDFAEDFTGSIKPVPASFTYNLGIFLVCLVMVILPLIYIAIIGLAGYGVYCHTVNHTAFRGRIRRRSPVCSEGPGGRFSRCRNEALQICHICLTCPPRTEPGEMIEPDGNGEQKCRGSDTKQRRSSGISGRPK